MHNDNKNLWGLSEFGLTSEEIDVIYKEWEKIGLTPAEIAERYIARKEIARADLLKLLVKKEGEDIETIPLYAATINDFILKLLAAYKIIKRPIKAYANGAVFIADENSTFDTIMAQYEKDDNEAMASYIASPEYEHKQKLYKQKVSRSQTQTDKCIKKLWTLDFTDYEAVLNRFYEYNESGSGYIDSSSQETVVLKTFHEHWYNENEHIDVTIADLRTDKVKYARYIIWQCFFWPIHPMVFDLIEDWKAQFWKATV